MLLKGVDFSGSQGIGLHDPQSPVDRCGGIWRGAFAHPRGKGDHSLIVKTDRISLLGFFTCMTCGDGDDMMDQKELAKKVKLIIMDVDGTLSDGRFFYAPERQTVKHLMSKTGPDDICKLAGLKTAVHHRVNRANRSGKRAERTPSQ